MIFEGPLGKVTDLDGCFQFEQYWLRDEDLPSFGAKIANLGFQELHLLPRSASSHLQQSVDDRIEIYLVLIRHVGLACTRDGGSIACVKVGPCVMTSRVSRLARHWWIEKIVVRR